MLITNGKEEKNVTKGVYKQLYEPLGYKPIVVIDVSCIEEPIVVEETLKEEIIEKNEKKPVSRKKTPKKSKK